MEQNTILCTVQIIYRCTTRVLNLKQNSRRYTQHSQRPNTSIVTISLLMYKELNFSAGDKPLHCRRYRRSSAYIENPGNQHVLKFTHLTKFSAIVKAAGLSYMREFLKRYYFRTKLEGRLMFEIGSYMINYSSSNMQHEMYGWCRWKYA